MYRVLDQSGQHHIIDAGTFNIEDEYVVFYKTSMKVAMFYKPISVTQSA